MLLNHKRLIPLASLPALVLLSKKPYSVISKLHKQSSPISLAGTATTGKLNQFKQGKVWVFAFVFNLHFCFSVIVSHSIYKWSTEYFVGIDEAGPSALSLPAEQ